jgi:hypothetical protein
MNHSIQTQVVGVLRGLGFFRGDSLWSAVIVTAFLFCLFLAMSVKQGRKESGDDHRTP